MKREFYNEQIRPMIKAGDIVLFRGRRFLARTIQYFDKAYYNHIGVVFEAGGRFFIMDSNARGVHPELLSDRCMGYKDVGIIRANEVTKEKITSALEQIIATADDGVKYDFFMLPRIAIKRKLGLDLKMLGSDKRDICSEWARRFTIELGKKCYDTGTWITPQDFVRLMDKTEFTAIRLNEDN